MAKNVTVAGASYSAVPSVDLPQTGGGTASFYDVSDTTAVATDVAEGKYFYTAAGVKTEGTGSGGIPSVYQDEYGYVVLDDEPGEAVVVQSLTATENKTYTAPTGVAYSPVVVNVSTSPTLQTVSKTYTPTESAITETVTYGSGYDGLQEVDVTVNAISSSYVGSGITRRDSTDLSASGATVSVPSGYYSSNASKSISSGTEGTPTATKGTVSSNSVTVTPSVTNAAGYISGGTHTGTGVSVSASELVSGTKSISSNGTNIDVTNYAAVNVNVSGGGGSSGPEDAVRFIDYDGTILHEYSAEDFLALSSMPSNPSHTGLTAQGWNWSLSDAQDYVGDYGFLDIGQMYVTSSGNTEIDIHLCTGTLSPYLGLAINGSVTIDWGDSTTTTSTGTTLTTQVRINHTYSSIGDYTITISVNSGSFAFYATNSYPLLNNNISGTNQNYLFSNCVRRIRMGNNCSLGSYAFYNCMSLSSITIPSTVSTFGTGYTFRNCRSLKSVTIPSGVTSIPNYFINTCSSLKYISIPKSVTYIQTLAVESCPSLGSLILPANASTGFSLTGNSSMSRRVYPSSNAIVNGNLVSVTIPSGVGVVNAYVFQNCRELKSVVISNQITSIGQRAFSSCYSLESVTIPNTVTSIGSYAFDSCYSLKSVTIPENIESLSNNAFSNCVSLESVTIPDSITSLESSLFAYCYTLKSVTLEGDITSIGASAFSTCYALQSITIPNTVTSIGGSAFNNCYSLSAIEIPSNVESIGTSAFNYCYSLTEIHIKATTPPTITNVNVFSNIRSDCIFYVPSASLDTYKTTNLWSTWASRMVGE